MCMGSILLYTSELIKLNHCFLYHSEWSILRAFQWWFSNIPSNLAATTEVQSASIIKGNHHVYILCQLSLGSRAKGCRVYMQIMNSFSSTSTETQLLSIPRKVDLYPARAEHCIRLPKTLIAGGFQVFDWNEQDGIGSVQVPSTVIKSMYAPCKEYRIIDWSNKYVLLLIAWCLATASYMCLFKTSCP